MEERIIDKDDERLIRIKKTAEGETDAEDALAPEGEEEKSEEEIVVTLPEGEEEYDEDLVGLTPSQLARELERRKKAEAEARAECEQLIVAAKEYLANKEYEKAASYFAQATCYSFADEEIVKGLWQARTKDYTDLSPFLVTENAEEFFASDDISKAYVLNKVKAPLTETKKSVEEEIERISPTVYKNQETRRQAFIENRRYYAVFLFVCFGMFALFLVATIVSATYITTTLSILPVVLTAVFGGLSLIAFILVTVLFLKFWGAHKLCRENDELSSTKEGARLEELQSELECLNLVLGEEEE